MRIGERALDRVVLTAQRFHEVFARRFERLDAARVMRGQRRCTAYEMERDPSRRARLGHEQGATVEIKRGQADLAWNRRARGLPAKPPGDHQMDDGKHVILELPGDPLAETQQPDNPLPCHRLERRVDRTQQKGVGETYSRESLPDDSRRERVKVEFDVGKLGHD